MPRTADRRLLACGLAALVLHGMVLLWSRGQADDEASIQGVAGRSVQVRMVSQARPTAEPTLPPDAVPSGPPALPEEAALADAADPALGDRSPVDLAGYVPRRWLTVAPEPTAPILLPFPTSFDENARYTAVMDLFIEADGRVGRIEFVGVALPEVLERVARNAFEHARFTPGQVHGRIVKSRIKVEVEFDNLGRG